MGMSQLGQELTENEAAKITAFLTSLTGDQPQVVYRQPTGVFAASIPRYVGLFTEKQLRDDKPDNIFHIQQGIEL
jgi:hypothetical protein